ncbi:MAG TPA: nitrous oxide reductase accessory protein NosL [Turneriella sp.]|nr:nitrous oxide reductase accessory protein NosL [Turneriella sp.]
MSIIRFSIILVLLTVAQCNVPEPVEIKVGSQQCAHCRMGIVDMRFNAQLVTTKSKRYHFDSIECMEEWKAEHSAIKIRRAFVKNTAAVNLYIDYLDARFVQSERLPSPMGAYLAAYATEDEVKEAIRAFGGREIQRSALLTASKNAQTQQ